MLQAYNKKKGLKRKTIYIKYLVRAEYGVGFSDKKLLSLHDEIMRADDYQEFCVVFTDSTDLNSIKPKQYYKITRQGTNKAF